MRTATLFVNKPLNLHASLTELGRETRPVIQIAPVLFDGVDQQFTLIFTDADTLARFTADLNSVVAGIGIDIFTK
jgi:hypothetical protein